MEKKVQFCFGFYKVFACEYLIFFDWLEQFALKITVLPLCLKKLGLCFVIKLMLFRFVRRRRGRSWFWWRTWAWRRWGWTWWGSRWCSQTLHGYFEGGIDKSTDKWKQSRTSSLSLRCPLAILDFLFSQSDADLTCKKVVFVTQF